jgi:hypothetical protein
MLAASLVAVLLAEHPRSDVGHRTAPETTSRALRLAVPVCPPRLRRISPILPIHQLMVDWGYGCGHG